MSHRFSATTLRRLGEATVALLSPLDAATADEWRARAAGRVRVLLRADVAYLGRAERGTLHGYSEELAPAALARLAAAAGRGGLRTGDAAVDRALHRTARDRTLGRAPSAVWTTAALDRRSCGRFRASPLYCAVRRATGVVDAAGLASARDGGRDLLGVGYTRPTAGRRAAALLGCLLAPFRAGIATLGWEDGPSPRAAADALDGEPVLLVDADGREVHRTATLARLLDGGGDAPWLLWHMHRVAREARLARRPAPGGSRIPGAWPAAEVRTRAARWHAVPTYLPPGSVPANGGVAVLLRPAAAPDAAPAAAPAAALASAFGFTPTEARVAARLAARASNAEVAAEFGVSEHTVRHHVAHVLAKLSVHSRREVGAALAGPGGPHGNA